MRLLKNIMIAATISATFAACSAQKPGADTTETSYTCPMHPEVTGKQGDKCPKCGMALTRK